MARRQKSFPQIRLLHEDRAILESWQRSTITPIGLVKRGQIILLLAAGKSVAETSQTVGIARRHVCRWARRFILSGIKGLSRAPHPGVRKAENKKIQSAFFSILHSPPSEYNINRTSWKLADLKKCLSGKGIFISQHVIRKIIKTAGYRWRKAKLVLTSNDPAYRVKLKRIQYILSTLGDNDFFFSIDEFGPFVIKIHGGRKIVAADEYPVVPQIQKSKGRLILTAALELSRNQITHLYSNKKDTAEVIRLLEVLLKKYKHARNLYLSWDTVSWHDSKQLYKKLKEINNRDYRKKYSTPIVKLVPLPKSAQFLNVIESVFSGMAKSIIHNSNYGSVDEAKTTIDRYFKERNEFFRVHPKKAGKKIWGSELIPTEFAEVHNCKDPRWR